MFANNILRKYKPTLNRAIFTGEVRGLCPLQDVAVFPNITQKWV